MFSCTYFGGSGWPSGADCSAGSPSLLLLCCPPWLRPHAFQPCPLRSPKAASSPPAGLLSSVESTVPSGTVGSLLPTQQHPSPATSFPCPPAAQLTSHVHLCPWSLGSGPFFDPDVTVMVKIPLTFNLDEYPGLPNAPSCSTVNRLPNTTHLVPSCVCSDFSVWHSPVPYQLLAAGSIAKLLL